MEYIWSDDNNNNNNNYAECIITVREVINCQRIDEERENGRNEDREERASSPGPDSLYGV